MFGIKGKVFLVTGAANGVGLASVEAFLKEGAKHVIGLDIKEGNLKTLESKLNLKYGDKKAKFISCDITKDYEKVYKNIWNEYGYIDVLVNNAGIINEKIENVKNVVNVNLTAVITGTLMAFETMHRGRGGTGGAVINIASLGALTPVPQLPTYSATKSAILKFSSCIGSDLYNKSSGVRVITACLNGVYDTDILVNGVDIPNEKLLIDEALDSLFAIGVETPAQSSKEAAQGIIEIYKKANSGSTWIIIMGEVTNINRIIEAGENLFQNEIKLLSKSHL